MKSIISTYEELLKEGKIDKEGTAYKRYKELLFRKKLGKEITKFPKGFRSLMKEVAKA